MPDPIRLYHFTSRVQLPSILAMGELLMTPDPYVPPVDGQPWPVVWLSSESGDSKTVDSVRAGLALDGAKMTGVGVFVRQDKTEVRIEVRPDFSQMMRWVDWARTLGVSERTIRSNEKWPCHADWWWISQAQIPSSEWIEISVRQEDGTWAPMFDAPTVVESDDSEVAPAPAQSPLSEKIKRFLRA